MKKLIFIFFISIAYGQSASYAPQVKIQSANSGSVDAFGRFRVTNPTTLFDAQNEYDASPLFWEHSLINGADTNFAFNGQPVVDLVTVATSGTRAIRQTREYFRYQSGNSLLVLFTATPHVGKQGMKKIWGYGDSLNGIFFVLTGDTLAVLKRSNATGSIVDSLVIQSNWNVDKGDGTGSSGFNLRTYRANVFFVDIAWLGVSRVRLGVVNERGENIILHEFQNSNNNNGVYMRTADLPIRLEIRHYSGSAVADTLTAICATVKSESGDNNLSGINNSISYYTAKTSPAGTFTPLLSIEPKATFNSIVNRSQVKEIEIVVMAITEAVEWQIVYNGTLTGSSFSSVGTSSTVEYDTSSTAVSGGLVLKRGIVVAGGVGVSAYSTAQAVSVLSKLPFSLDIKGTNPIKLTIAVRGVTGAGTVRAIMNWREIY